MSASETEFLEGVGDVSESGSIICRVHYRLTVLQQSEGLELQLGSIAIHPDSDKVTGRAWDVDALFHKAQNKLTLQLEDGRRLDFFVKDNRGKIRGTGKVHRP